MRFTRREPDRAEAERLLSSPAASADSRDPLARLLAAAAAPPRPHELAGEEAAVEAFRRAQHAPSPARPVAPSRGRPLAVATLAVAAVALTATAGIAVAAGRLGDGRPAPSSPATSAATTAPAVPPAAPATPTGPLVGDPAETAPTSEEVAELCHAYLTAERSDGPREGAAFHRLIELAGGEDDVGRYCARALATPTGRPSPRGLSTSAEAGGDSSNRGPRGRGVTPPGHGGTPPGLGGTPPGKGGTPPGLGGTPPGHGGDVPGRGRGIGGRPS